MQKRQASQQ